MKIPVDWLKEFVKIDLKPEEIAEKLTMVGFLVEKIEDGVLEVENLANRGDCLSILGISRELAAITGQKINLPQNNLKIESLDLPLEINIAQPKSTPKYSYRLISNLKIGSSPDWLVKRLEQMGGRSVNNIVDVTNYVMLAVGQPLHAFDYDKIEPKIISIRNSEDSEKITTLDGTEHKLAPETLVIENNGRLIDLAGIMGGENSQVSHETGTIILQAAIFDPVQVRRSSKKLNFSTDASYRYERGVDFEFTQYVLDFATNLILKLSKNAKAGEIVDLVLEKEKPIELDLSVEKINHLLGTNLSKEVMEKILKNLGFKIGNKITVPSWRHDIYCWQDLAEEIARISGYVNIKMSYLKPKPQRTNLEFNIEQKTASIISSLGFVETLSYSFVSEKDLQNFGQNPANVLEVTNPISKEYQYLRPNLKISVIKQIAKNPWAPEVKLFEIGNVFNKKSSKTELLIASTQKKLKTEEIISNLKTGLGIKNIEYQEEAIEARLLGLYKIRRPVRIISINFNQINKVAKPIKIEYQLPEMSQKYQPISKFPPTIRDLAFIIDANILADEVLKTIKVIDPKIFLVEIFDEFASDKFGKGKKNLAFHIWLQDLHKNLNPNEVDNIVEKISNLIQKKYQAKIRNF
ncbi:MAG TPA: phenylalanine--tRNA ligase subunit beta [Patescibacteria group bacterium]|nr:phenylalanine--tRNA ligase subunit beta [Patescibacteria group bacterium]